ncbi:MULTISPECIES: thioredoxin [Carboxydothermus]|uniref:Thioredoxin n=2 Tax=Carboxydothermus TaxID=129957 RepID=Q3AA19_CARHZ|nr:MULTISPECIES: thioredoxin [Carboxydothermus]ABB14810.1 thioredoxin [Carboxydothermus hydrogenoformans Z-2901]NYE58037.1 thioredoxin 1 [Carboxydothermus ferrireducens DSM 11255]
MGIITLTDENFETEALKREGLIIVDFWAEWCGPCRMIAPILEEIAQEYEGKLTVGKLDVDSNPETPRRYGIMSIPTLLFIKNGEEVGRTVGFKHKNELMKIIIKNL